VRHHVPVIKPKAFEAEVADQFGFLVEAGFQASPLDAPHHDRRPRTLRMTFSSPDARVEVSLALAFAGEEMISTRVETADGSWDFGPATAHKGQEMRKALSTQALEVTAAIPGL
jgi:hypothetical protein